jgi:hypothetical protein
MLNQLSVQSVGVLSCKHNRRKERQKERKMNINGPCVAIFACNIMINMTNLDHGKKEGEGGGKHF